MIGERKQILLELYKRYLKDPYKSVPTIEDFMDTMNYTNRNLLIAHLQYLKDKELVDFTPMIGVNYPIHNISIAPEGIDYVEENLDLRGVEVKK